MTWTDHAIFWQVYPLGFTGAPIRPGSDAERALTHRLGHLSHWLDHVVELGCNGLLLGPIFTSSTVNYPNPNSHSFPVTKSWDALNGRGRPLITSTVVNA